MAAPGQQNTAHPKVHSLMTNIVTGVGAGIYEELVFRLILICALMVLFQDVIGLSHQNAIVAVGPDVGGPVQCASSHHLD